MFCATALATLLALIQGPDGASDRNASPLQPSPRDASASRDKELAIDGAALQRAQSAATRGLAWLAARQTASGAFTGIVGHKMQNDYVELDAALTVREQIAQGRGHLGVSAICGMAFLAAGHLPDRGEHGKVVQKTIDYVLAHGQENGFLSDAGTRMYSHAFATLFLAEVYGMAGGAKCKVALERAVNLIVDSQNQHGGWRYNPFDRETDLSVTVCQLQALRAARNIGIKAPDDTIDRAIDYVKQSQVRGAQRTRGFSRRSRGSVSGQFYYKIHGRGAYDKPDEFAINAAALTALASAGVYDRELHEPTLDFLERAYGDTADYYASHYFFWYGHYYGVQAMYTAGSPYWEPYFEELRTALLSNQKPDGSWPNETGPGPALGTAMAVLMLEIPYRFLPIFQR
jgi:hypothetical protein